MSRITRHLQDHPLTAEALIRSIADTTGKGVVEIRRHIYAEIKHHLDRREIIQIDNEHYAVGPSTQDMVAVAFNIDLPEIVALLSGLPIHIEFVTRAIFIRGKAFSGSK